jgi:hypothetical protein
MRNNSGRKNGSQVEKALESARESRTIDFKQQFDVTSKGEWCEIIAVQVSSGPSSALLKTGDIEILFPLRTKQVGPWKIDSHDGCCLDCGSQNRRFGHYGLLGQWTAV